MNVPDFPQLRETFKTPSDWRKTRPLVGEHLLEMAISQDRQVLGVRTTTGISYVWAEADCCSMSWIEHFDFEDIIGGKLLGIRMRRVGYDELLPTAFPDFQQEADEQVFYELITDKGAATIEMRNSSNGYYGGCMSFATTDLTDAN